VTGVRRRGSEGAPTRRRFQVQPSDLLAGLAHSPPCVEEAEMRKGISAPLSSLPPAAASFAAVAAAVDPTPFSAMASAASEKFAEIRAVFQPPARPWQDPRGC
jgi:hypothetical protein